MPSQIVGMHNLEKKRLSPALLFWVIFDVDCVRKCLNDNNSACFCRYNTSDSPIPPLPDIEEMVQLDCEKSGQQITPPS